MGWLKFCKVPLQHGKLLTDGCGGVVEISAEASENIRDHQGIFLVIPVDRDTMFSSDAESVLVPFGYTTALAGTVQAGVGSRFSGLHGRGVLVPLGRWGGQSWQAMTNPNINQWLGDLGVRQLWIIDGHLPLVGSIVSINTDGKLFFMSHCTFAHLSLESSRYIKTTYRKNKHQSSCLLRSRRLSWKCWLHLRGAAERSQTSGWHVATSSDGGQFWRD